VPYETTVRFYSYEEPDLDDILDVIEDELGYTVIDTPTTEEV
jgi:hypothetical protein